MGPGQLTTHTAIDRPGVDGHMVGATETEVLVVFHTEGLERGAGRMPRKSSRVDYSLELPTLAILIAALLNR